MIARKTGLGDDQPRKRLWSSSSWPKARHASFHRSKKEALEKSRSEENRELNREADKQSVGLLPCLLNPEGYSVSVRNAKRQNRGEQKRLASRIAKLEQNVKQSQETIIDQQKVIVDELLQQYPHLKKQICLLMRNAPQLLMRLGLPRIRTPQPSASMKLEQEKTDLVKVPAQERELSLIGMSCWDGDPLKRTPTSIVLKTNPPPNSNPHKIQPPQKRKRRPPRLNSIPPKVLPKIEPRVPEITVLSGITPSTSPEEEPTAPAGSPDDKKVTPLPVPPPPPPLPRGESMLPSGYFRFPSLSNSTQKTPEKKQTSIKAAKVSEYAKTDFSFNQDIFKPSLGMSFMKRFSRERELRESIALTAEKHISACQASSLRTRGSRAEQSFEDLRTLLEPGSTWSIQGLRNQRMGTNQYGGQGLQRSRTFHQGRAKFWSMTDLSTKSMGQLGHLGTLIVSEKK